MTGWRFAFSRRWLGYLALALAFAVACVFLAQWQLARREQARAEITRVQTNWDRAPQPVEKLLPTLGAFDSDDKWTPVSLSGHYLVEKQILVRGRPLDGAGGFEVLVPLQLANGRVFIVDRGWVAAGDRSDSPDSIPDAPAGLVTVVARLKASEPTIPGRSAPAGQIATIHLPDIAAQLGKPIYTGAYGLLATEDPAPPTRPIAVAKPQPDEGPHLSYAFQWIMFGILGFVALGWAIRQEYRIRNRDAPAEQARIERQRRKAAAQPRSDAEVEDAILDREHSR
ncbi:MAG: SURF1 family protein [Salinibacterium sp.]|nr:MAG: SURF1 family protein [Salinibacterium sp.]